MKDIELDMIPRKPNLNAGTPDMVRHIDLAEYLSNPYLPRVTPNRNHEFYPLPPRQQRRGTLNRDRLRALGAFDEELLWMLQHPQWIPKHWKL